MRQIIQPTNEYSCQVMYHLSKRERSPNKLVLRHLTDVVICSTTLLYNQYCNSQNYQSYSLTNGGVQDVD